MRLTSIPVSAAVLSVLSLAERADNFLSGAALAADEKIATDVLEAIELGLLSPTKDCPYLAATLTPEGREVLLSTSL
jgi:hypothetical protein